MNWFNSRRQHRLYNWWRPLVVKFGTTTVGRGGCIQLDDPLCNVLVQERIDNDVVNQIWIYIHHEFIVNSTIKSINVPQGLRQANFVTNNRTAILNATRCPPVSVTMVTAGEFQFQAYSSYFIHRKPNIELYYILTSPGHPYLRCYCLNSKQKNRTSHA